MNRRFVKDFMLLYNQGWRPYNTGKLPDSVYEKFGCPHNSPKGKGPYWFVRGDVFLCVTCNKHCSLTRPEGTILPLPLVFPPDKRKRREFSMTPGELVTRKKLLRIDEAAYCLNVSERLVYNWIYEGKLRQARGVPVRVSADDVAFFMQNFEE